MAVASCKFKQLCIAHSIYLRTHSCYKYKERRVGAEEPTSAAQLLSPSPICLKFSFSEYSKLTPPFKMYQLHPLAQ